MQRARLHCLPGGAFVDVPAFGRVPHNSEKQRLFFDLQRDDGQLDRDFVITLAEGRQLLQSPAEDRPASGIPDIVPVRRNGRLGTDQESRARRPIGRPLRFATIRKRFSAHGDQSTIRPARSIVTSGFGRRLP